MPCMLPIRLRFLSQEGCIGPGVSIAPVYAKRRGRPPKIKPEMFPVDKDVPSPVPRPVPFTPTMVTEDRSGFTDAERKEERSPLWAQCDACSQWTTVEEDVAWPPSSGKWKCKMNTWNPGLAKCVTQVEFYEQYRAFVLKRNEDHLLRKVACIHGRPVDLWHLYNLVTQLGGWNTIYTNRWQSLLYCDKPEWAHHTDIGNRLKVIYTKYLLPYEEVCCSLGRGRHGISGARQPQTQTAGLGSANALLGSRQSYNRNEQKATSLLL